MSSETIVNKVAESGLVEIDLETYYPKGEVVVFDLKDYLFMGLIVKEKDFREALKQHDFSVYKDKLVAVTCTADAIVPVWAYMLVASYLQPQVKELRDDCDEDQQDHQRDDEQDADEDSHAADIALRQHQHGRSGTHDSPL